jgi:hypothetical protein
MTGQNRKEKAENVEKHNRRFDAFKARRAQIHGLRKKQANPSRLKSLFQKITGAFRRG